MQEAEKPVKEFKLHR